MRVFRPTLHSFFVVSALSLVTLLFAGMVFAQGSYRAQVRGVVSDQSGALMTNAKVTITNVGTNISQTAQTNDHGEYFFTGLRPATYTIKVEAKGFRISETQNVVLQVDQQTSVDVVLHPLGVNETVEVTTSAPLLDTDSATLGTDITSEYVKDIPLINRNFFGLTFLSGGVTEAAGSGTTDNYPTGTNFVSNGQRNATAEVRLDGALISAPEQGEGGNSNIYYEPVIESVQEFKVQNNSFSAEFGNNGGTVVNMVLKSGTNAFHGSGWYFLQRSGMNARDFFNPAPNPKPESARDQAGFSIGGPIKKNKTFFFFDFEKVRNNAAISGLASVPTLAERGLSGTGYDFSANGTHIYDPKLGICSATQSRPQVGTDCNGNTIGATDVIPAGEVDPIGLAVLNLYPKPNVAGSGPGGQFNNYAFSGTAQAPDYQFDLKIDHEINDRNRISGRYSRQTSNFYTPIFLGDGNLANGGSINDGIGGSPTTAQNAGLEYTWTVNPRMVWTNRISVDRVHQAETSNIPTISSFNSSLPAGVPGLPSLLEQANGVNRMPSFFMSSGGGTGPWDDLYDQCCVNTTFAHTLASYSSQLVISKGTHLIKIGGEQRLLYNNFFQPPGPTGVFNFTDFVTSPTPNSDTDNSGNLTGNAFASLLYGYADNFNPYPQEPTALIVYPAVANKSKETGFYFQDDWKVTSKLTLNLGIRYEWSTPYNERYNRLQFSDFTGDTGISLDLSSAQSALQPYGVNFPSSMELPGTTLFANSSMRSVPVYRKDVGPRLGFAYQLDSQTVIRGGAGIYFGMSPATNFQYPGTAFRKTATIFFTQDNFNTQYATLSNPFPTGFTGPQGTQYGKLADWGYSNNNDLGTTAARDADIYQWNLGIERGLPGQIVLGVDYSANRSTHLPWSGTNNRDFMSSALLAKVSQAVHANYDAANGPGACDTNSCVSNLLATPVNNPFYPMFSASCSSGPCFNEPDSLYTAQQIPLGYLLNPYPQFTGDFEGLMLEEASSWYNAMQIRFQKRTSHNISFEGSYTVSKSTDNSSAGRNNWVGSLSAGLPQQLDQLNKEHSISANDTPQRLAAAVVVDLPIGRKQWIGGNMNRGLDAVIGGWSVATMITEQSGQPIAIGMNSARLTNGTQRPDVVCSQLKSGVSMKAAALSWEDPSPLSFFNSNCFGDPGDQNPGNAPRYFPGLRVNGIHNVDMNIYKSFVPKEGTKIDLRAEIFNLANHPRFASPDTSFEGQTFGFVSSTGPGYLPRYFQFGVRFEF
ncbi:MAG TPA: carboxypeptidase regulatory-like domain-containing protein [Candidatus Sulfotelmatobacter sp.]|nr:carboxypeptidase regulatory-like domain-containing protein [Candidatus Sulfotelmatobacter sp.]